MDPTREKHQTSLNKITLSLKSKKRSVLSLGNFHRLLYSILIIFYPVERAWTRYRYWTAPFQFGRNIEYRISSNRTIPVRPIKTCPAQPYWKVNAAAAKNLSPLGGKFRKAQLCKLPENYHIKDRYTVSTKFSTVCTKSVVTFLIPILTM